MLQLLQGGPQCQMHFYVLAEKSSTTDFFRNKWVITCYSAQIQTHYLSYNPPNHLYLKHKEIKPEGLVSKEAPSEKERIKGVNGLP